MESTSSSLRKQRFRYFIGGAIVACLSLFIPFGLLPWIAVLVVFAFRLVKGPQVHAIAYTLGTAIPSLIFLCCLLFGPSIENIIHRREFDADLWQAQESSRQTAGRWPSRLCMVDHLMRSGRLDGLSSNQVVELLGRPHDKSFPSEAASCDIHYYLGPERGLIRIDDEWLFITFTNDSKVDRYWLYTD